MTGSETVSDAIALSRWDSDGGAGAPETARRAHSKSDVLSTGLAKQVPSSLPAAIVSMFNLQKTKLAPATSVGDLMDEMKQ